MGRPRAKMLSAMSSVGLNIQACMAQSLDEDLPRKGVVVGKAALWSGSWHWRRWQLKTACLQWAQQLGPKVSVGGALWEESQCPLHLLMLQVHVPGSGLWDRLAGQHELPSWVPGNFSRARVVLFCLFVFFFSFFLSFFLFFFFEKPVYNSSWNSVIIFKNFCYAHIQTYLFTNLIKVHLQ